jgi:hypothetical protein
MELNDHLTIDIDSETDSCFTCTICMEDKSNDEKCITNCDHIFCKSCIHEWFDKKKTSCPSCRTDIEYYSNNKNNNIIVKVKEENRNNVNINQTINENDIMLRNLQSKIYKLNMFIFINIGYLLYNLLIQGSKDVEIMYYQRKYENCSNDLTQIENTLSETNEYMIYDKDIFYECEIPEVYISYGKCNEINIIS